MKKTHDDLVPDSDAPEAEAMEQESAASETAEPKATEQESAASETTEPEATEAETAGSGTGVREATVDKQGTRINMNVTVPAEAVASTVNEISQTYRDRVRMSGFRRGKAPMSMIRQRFREEIREHALEQLIPEHVSAELEARSLSPIHQPVLDSVEFDLNGPLTFSVHFDVAPEVEVKGYKGLKASRPRLEVSDEAIERGLGELRERAAKIEPLEEDEGAAANDFVRVKVSLYPRDGKGRRLAEEERFVHLGNEQAIPGLNSQLEGLQAGDAREFVTRLGDSYPDDLLVGKEVLCKVEVLDVKRRHLPAVDDELAKDLGFADLQELRAKSREDMTGHMEEEAERDVERQLLEQLLEANPIDAPESMVEARLDHHMRRAAEDLARQGLDPSKSVDWNSFRADSLPHAERAVREEILLDHIVEAEDITIEDDAVVAEIERLQAAGPADTSTIVRKMRQDGSFERLRQMLARQGALECLKRHATIDSVAEEPPEDPAD